MITEHHHDGTLAIMVEKRRGGTRPKQTEQVALVVRLDIDQREALARWSIAEDRPVSAQVRKVLAAAIPAEYYSPTA